MIPREWARRHAQAGNERSALARLIAGESDAEVARATGLPPATVAGVRSYYDLLEPGPQVCDGTACHFAGGGSLAAALGPHRPASAVRCLGPPNRSRPRAN